MMIMKLAVLFSVLSASAAQQCSMCPDGSAGVINPNLAIPARGTDTCQSTFDESLAFATNTSDCQAAQATSPACCDGVAVCSFCSDGSIPADLSREITFPGVPQGASTCGEFYYGSHFFAADNCLNNILIGSTAFPFDFPNFCGCTGATASEDSCGDYCPNSAVNNPDSTIQVQDAPDLFTCQDVADLFPFLRDPTQCSTLAALRPICCKGASTCTLCNNDDPISNPDRKIPYDNLTCENSRLLVYLATDCTPIENLQANGVDLRGYCGCQGEGAFPAENCGGTCPEGTEMSDPTRSVTRANATCADVALYANYLKPGTEVCTAAQEDLVGCCDQAVGGGGSSSVAVVGMTALLAVPLLLLL